MSLNKPILDRFQAEFGRFQANFSRSWADFWPISVLNCALLRPKLTEFGPCFVESEQVRRNLVNSGPNLVRIKPNLTERNPSFVDPLCRLCVPMCATFALSRADLIEVGPISGRVRNFSATFGGTEFSLP